MVRILLLLLSFTTLAGTLRAATADDLFTEAQQAYDRGNLLEAREAYLEVLKGGVHSAAVYYNLGNTHFRMGELGKSIAYYRKAQLMTPGDPDVEANLRFAREQAGVQAPDQPFYLKVTQLLNKSNWVALTVGSFWLGLLALSAGMLMPSRIKLFRKTAALCGVTFLVGLQSLFGLHMMAQHPEVVVTGGRTDIRFAPLDEATSHFSAPEGTILRYEDETDGWIKVSLGDKTGWIPDSSCDILIY